MSSYGHNRWQRWAARTVPLALTVGALAGLPTTAYAADPIDGPQTVGDAMFPNVGNGGYDALHYDVSFAWSALGVVSGRMTGQFDTATTTMAAATTGAPLRSFSMDLEGLTVDSVLVDGVAATFERVQDVATTKFKLIITPATPVEGTFTTAVTYHGSPVRHTDADGSFEGWNATTDGATFLSQPIGAMTAYPHNNTPADKATYTFTIDAPTTIASATGTGAAGVAGNGELESKTASSDGSRTTWVWDQEEQMASELAMVSIGKFDVLESDITLASGRTLHEWTFVDSGLSATAKNTINTRRATFKSILDGLERFYGPYPGNSVGIVSDPVPQIGYALETQDRSFFTGAPQTGTLIHEFAHQWYGNAVSPRLWTDIWVNEGMAEWVPSYYTNVLNSPTPNPGAVETSTFDSWNGVPASDAAWETPPGAQTDPADLYEFQTYRRGAMFWQALETAVREEDFLAIVKTWQERNSGTSRSGDELKALAEELSGRDLDAFWQDWIYDADKPAWPGKYDLSITSDPVPGAVEPGDVLTYTLSAANVGKVALADGVVEVDLSDVLDDATLGTLPDGLAVAGDTLTWTVPSTALATSATVSFPVVVDADASMATLVATAAPASLGGLCASACSTTSGVDIQPVTPAPLPTVVGTPKVGEALTAGTEGWAAGVAFTYQWSVDGVEVEGADDATYTPVAADLGEVVAVAVTGSLDGYLPVTRESEPSAAVLAGTLTTTPVPTVAGAPSFDATLTATTGTWDEGTVLSLQWLRDGTPIAGATGPSYRLGLADLGTRISVQVTGTKTGYATLTRTSEAGAPVAALTFAPSGKVKVAGKAKVGKVLSARPTGWGSDVSVQYTWRAGAKKVGGKATLKLTRAMLGKKVTVTVTVSKPGYVTKTVKGSARGRVQRR